MCMLFIWPVSHPANPFNDSTRAFLHGFESYERGIHILQLTSQSSSKPHTESDAPLSAVAKLKQFQSHMSKSLCVNFDQTRLHPLRLSTLDLGRDTLVTGKQVVEIKHTLKEPRSLADPVRTTGHTMELHLRDICWSQANGEFTNISPYFCVYQLLYVVVDIANIWSW